jgi:hypothetical protein
MDQNKALTVTGLGIAGVLAVLAIAGTISLFAPDATAQRIQACMTQPNMQYITRVGIPQCLPIERNDND